MSNTGGRKMRHIFDGTGVYIALFLVVTALAVAGYWTLIPHSSTPTQKAAVEPTPTPVTTQAAPKTEPPRTAVKPQVPEPSLPDFAPEPSAPAQSAVSVTIPPVEREVVPTAPALIVAPLIGETLMAFSMDTLLYSETMGDWRTHDGVDIAAEAGTHVCAACAGTVTDVRDDDLLGTTVVISHDDGCDTIYANLQSEPTVKVGDFVTAGQVIGSVGKTALCESAASPHLHFSVTRDGEYIDPAEYLK